MIKADALSFDVRGVVHTYRPPNEGGESSLLDFPEEVRGIEVNTSTRELHFLHAASFAGIWERTSTEHLLLGSYLITYADGKCVDIPVHTRDRDINANQAPKQAVQSFYPDGGFIQTWKSPSLEDFSGSTIGSAPKEAQCRNQTR